MRGILIILISLIAFNVKAQDAVVTQKFNNENFINPALTGNGEKDNRLSFLYRDQWRSVIVPYSSTYLAYDRKLLKQGNNLVSGGVTFFYDKAGDGSLTTFNPSLSVAYTRFFKDRKFALSTGLQLGYLQTSVDASKIQFNNQYGSNGFDPNIGSGESFENRSLVNLGLGINLNTKIYGASNIDVGFAVNNPHQPAYSFSSFIGDPRPIRYSTYLTGELFATKSWSLSPSFYFQGQEKAKEFHTSLLVNYYTKSKKVPLKLSLGGGYRNNDAVLTYAGVKVKDIQVGFSYDVNTSSFTDATNNKGGFELSLKYEFEKRKGKTVIVEEINVDTIYVEDSIIIENDTLIEAAIEEVIEKDPSPIVDPISIPKIPVVPKIIESDPPEEVSNLQNVFPLQLFFDNDQPDPNTYSTTTNTDYISSYNQYISRKGEYANKVGQAEADTWFAKVTDSKDQLENAVNQLKSLLDKGYTVRLTLKGYASPLAASKYNANLSMRRIESVIIYLKYAKGAILYQAIENGQLIIEQRPFGEDASSNYINDNASNKKQSIYRSDAAYERRVEIIKIEVE